MKVIIPLAGKGTVCVCGRSRVPLPANGMITFMAPTSLRDRSGR